MFVAECGSHETVNGTIWLIVSIRVTQLRPPSRDSQRSYQSVVSQCAGSDGSTVSEHVEQRVFSSRLLRRRKCSETGLPCRSDSIGIARHAASAAVRRYGLPSQSQTTTKSGPAASVRYSPGRLYHSCGSRTAGGRGSP